MRRSTLEILRCPTCRERLALSGGATDERIHEGELACEGCRRRYVIANGYPRFIDVERLEGWNKPIAKLYDKHAGLYLAASLVGQRIGARLGMSRRDLVDRAQPRGRVLEVSIGPGVNIPYLREHPAVSEIHGLDISQGQLDRCVRYAGHHGWPVELSLGMAEALPYADGAFDSVFHVGGINFFTDPKAAIDEMVRVAKPGAPILIADETEKTARSYDWLIPGFRRIFGKERKPIRPPLDLLPGNATQVQSETIWRDMLYVITFRTPMISTRAARPAPASGILPDRT